MTELGYDVSSIAGSAEQKFVNRVVAHVPAPKAEAIHLAACCRRVSCFSPAMQPVAGPAVVPSAGSSTPFLSRGPREAELQLQV